MGVRYLRLTDGSLPDLDAARPFRAIMILDQALTAERCAAIGAWLVRSGCLYALTWGADCEALHDAVDGALLDVFEGRDIPDDRHVMTTWHEDEPLSEALWFAAHLALHPDVELDQTLIVHVAAQDQAAEILALYRDAQAPAV